MLAQCKLLAYRVKCSAAAARCIWYSAISVVLCELCDLHKVANIFLPICRMIV